MTIASIIRSNRRRLELSQEALSLELGLSHNCVNKWECGYSEPQYKNVKELCKALGITPNELFEWGEG